MNPRSSITVLILSCFIIAAFFMPWIQGLGFVACGYKLGQFNIYGNFA